VIGTKKTLLAIVSQKECVACGACVKVCPVDAIEVYKGISAEVDSAKCVGCTKCVIACPACAINMETDR